VAPLWRDGLKHPASGQMAHLRTFFESLPWMELRPAQDLVRDQPGAIDTKKFVACAATLDRKTAVFYFPPGTVQSLVPNLTPSDTHFYFDPRTGERHSEAGFKPDPNEDWAIVIQRK
jgi:hypothetical protein